MKIYKVVVTDDAKPMSRIGIWLWALRDYVLGWHAEFVNPDGSPYRD